MVTAFRNGHWPSLLGAWLHFEVSFMTWLLISALSVPIAEEFTLSPTQKGLLIAVPLLGGALFRVVVGCWVDRHSAKRTGLVLLACQLVAVSWSWLGAATYGQLVAVGVLLGMAGASFAVVIPIASRAYPPAHQGFAMGVVASANSGAVLAMLVAPRIAEAVGWRGVFGVMITPLLLTLILFAALVRNNPVKRSLIECEGRTCLPMGHLLRRSSLDKLCLVYAVTFGGFVGFSSILPIFLHDHYGVDAVTAGSITALCSLCGSVLRPIGGHIADRMGGLRLLRMALLIIAGLLVGVGALPPLTWAIPLAVLAAASMGFSNGVAFQVVSQRYLNQIGVATGLIGAAGSLGGCLWPVCLGTLKEITGSFQPGLWLLAVLAAWTGNRVALALGRVTPATHLETSNSTQD
jgi:NNP family nitrate/nitrite transporter-like MFS transporter